MSTRKKITTKKTTTKKTTTSSRSGGCSRSRPSAPPPSSRTPARPAAPSEPTIQVKPYKHVGDQVNAFMAEHPNGVYFHLDAVSKNENESAIRSLDPKTPTFVDGKSFTASELRALGFEVFQNGQGGKLIGIRGV